METFLFAMTLTYLIYQSRALIPFDSKLHNEILKVSQSRNKVRELTGFLYRDGDTFLQYLEGPSQSIADLTGELIRDPRHSDFTVLAKNDITKRYFFQWSMGFVNPKALSLCEVFNHTSGGQRIKIHEPMDLIMFLAGNDAALQEMDVAC
jgi:hypothetical protein